MKDAVEVDLKLAIGIMAGFGLGAVAGRTASTNVIVAVLFFLLPAILVVERVRA